MACNAGYDWCKDKAVVHKDGDEEYCVFHAPADKKGIDFHEFNKLVFDEINEAIADNRACDLSGTVFPGDVDFFEEELPKANFILAHFTGEAVFMDAQFGGQANFGGAHFDGNADFRHANIGGEAVFKDAQFKDWAYFDAVTIEEGTDFSGAQFNNADFYEETFKGKAIFESIRIEGQKRIRFHNVNLEEASFLKTDLRHCDFTTCKWREKNGRYILLDETEYYDDNNKAKFLKSPKERINRVEDIEDLYRTLKQKSREKFDEYQYSFWHMSEKEMQWERTTLKNPAEWLVLFLYKFSSGYGEEPKRAFLWLLLLISFAFTFVCCASSSIGIVEKMIMTIDYLTFRRPEDPIKGPLGYYINLTSHILVPLQAALFAFALRNRFRR